MEPVLGCNCGHCAFYYRTGDIQEVESTLTTASAYEGYSYVEPKEETHFEIRSKEYWLECRIVELRHAIKECIEDASFDSMVKMWFQEIKEVYEALDNLREKGE